MFKVFKIAVLVICGLMLVFVFLPTGNSATDIVDGYQSTLSFASNGSMFYQFLSTIPAGDPLLNAVEESAGGRVDYVWVTEEGTPVTPYVKASTFPKRGGPRDDWGDYTSGTGKYHLGTDLDPTGHDIDTTPLYQVAIWGGTVIHVGWSPTGWGHYVVIDHGNGFYTRYAHMGYGNAGSADGVSGAPGKAPLWQEKFGDESSVLVNTGDVVAAGQKLGCLGTTGNSTGPHAHIELILCPQGFDDGRNRAKGYYYAGIDNILRGGKRLNEVTWYQLEGRDALNDMATWGELTEEIPPK